MLEDIFRIKRILTWLFIWLKRLQACIRVIHFFFLSEFGCEEGPTNRYLSTQMTIGWNKGKEIFHCGNSDTNGGGFSQIEYTKRASKKSGYDVVCAWLQCFLI
jgi:hypothetical protein